MILQVIPTTSWLIGLGFMFVLAFFMTYITYRTTQTFMLFLTIFNGFMVYGGLLPLWTLILNIIGVSILLAYKLSQNRGV